MNTEHKSNTPADIKDCWQTPKGLFKTLDNEFNFECDVAASVDNTLCKLWFDEEDSALNNEWYKVNYLNPPYSNIGPWVDKAIIEHQKGKTIVMLVPSDTSVQWYKRARETCHEVRFISGRISFVNAETQKAEGGNNKGSVILVWRANAPKYFVEMLLDRDDLL